MSSAARQDETELAGALLGELFPLCRSITGDGVRQTLAILGRHMDLKVHEYATGTAVFDWTIPNEWNIRDAYIANAAGERVVDFQANNLHVVSYSVPHNARMSFAELRPHLHTLPDMPHAIPYRTSYYNETWGFCLSHDQLATMDTDATYDVVIDATLAPGSLTLGDAKLDGASGREYLISTYCCHPSMANDNLSGPIVSALLYRRLAGRKLRHSYRFAVVPETIGAIAYLAHNEDAARKLDGGFVVTTCGGPGAYGYKETFQGDHLIDRAAKIALRDAGHDPIRYPFVPDGSDERQYSSPGFRIPVGLITKDKFYEYDAYHTSLDDMSFVAPETLVATADIYMAAIEVLETNRTYRSLNPNCEAQLGRRGLYPSLGGSLNQSASGDAHVEVSNQVDVISWLLFLADGEHDLLSVAERSGFPYADIARMAERLVDEGLLEAVVQS